VWNIALHLHHYLRLRYPERYWMCRIEDALGRQDGIDGVRGGIVEQD
jgi:hypothetical protein